MGGSIKFDIQYINMPKDDLLLRTVPADVLKIVLKEQAKEKERRNLKQFSLSTTIFKIIRAWNSKCNES